MAHLPAGVRRRLAAVGGRLFASDNQSAAEGAVAIDEVANYEPKLSAPEDAIVTRLGDWLTGKRMLDLGMGAGRTTEFFAPLVGSYVGIDYSRPLVDLSRERFGRRFHNVTLAYGDARDLSAYGAGSFDFVFFSFQGIDCVDHEGRLRVLSEMRRVCAPDGYAAFSSHNLYASDRLFQPHPHSRTLRSLAGSIAWQALFRTLNEPLPAILRQPHALVRDGSLRFGIELYYIRPSEALAQLASAGFGGVEIYGVDGRRLSAEEAEHAPDLYFHYLASPAAPHAGVEGVIAGAAADPAHTAAGDGA